MRLSKVLIGATLSLLLLLPAAAMAQSRLPQDGSFHLDLRALTLFNYGVLNLERDDPADTESSGILSGGLGLNGMGVKVGYLINGHHDVGAHLLFGGTDTGTTTAYDAGGDDLEYHTNDTRFRIAGFYNYNFHVNDWVMPYVGPLVGVDTWISTAEDLNDGDSKTTTTWLTPYGGIEGGVKLFPFEHVAFDLGGMVTAGSASRVTAFGNSELDDDQWSGARIDFGTYAGLNIYF
ncbi:MAG: hypothetical protein P9M14_02470 [Candidatus Alcyoniella australis]|nr:hypothetical protein [Candidatus Alcyoniella australis]